MSDISFGVIALEKELGITFPKVFSIPTHHRLSDPSIAPMFNRIIIPNMQIASSWMSVMRYFNWYEAVMIYSE